MNRKYIRKLVLQEFRNRLVEQEEKKQKSFPNIEAAQQAKENLEKNAALLAEGVPPEGPAGNGTMITKAQAIKLADDLKEAISGTELASGQLFGMGTNEALIIETLKKIPTLADLSFVSHVFGEKHSGLFGTDSLADALEDEYGTFTEDEFYDVRSEIEAIYNRGLFALNGEVYTLRQIRQVEKRAKAAKQDLLKNVDKGNVDTFGDFAYDAAGVPAATGVAVGAAAGVGAAIAAGGFAGGAAGAGLTGAAVGATGAAGLAALEVGATAATGASLFGTMAGGGGAFLGALGLSNPLGWAVLAVTAIGVGALIAYTDAEFNETELKMLSPDFYRGLGTMFKELSKNFQAAADAINLGEYSEEGEEGSAGPGGEGKEYDSLPFGLERSFIENIVRTMNAYDDTRGGLEGYIEPAPAEAWNRSIQNAWKVFAPHALLNCAIYEFHRDEVDKAESWLDLSKAMKSDFPGYTPNPRGCLAFCLDAYYDEVRYGKERPSGGGSGGGGGGGKDEDGPPALDPDIDGQRGGGGKIIIRSVAGSKGNVPLSEPFNESVENDLIKAINQQFSTKARRSTVKAVSLEFDIKVRGSGNIRVRRRKPIGAVERDNFKGNLQRMVKDALQDRMQVFTKKKRKERKEYMTADDELRITIDIPGGYRIPR
jgi:hypothetical protein